MRKTYMAGGATAEQTEAPAKRRRYPCRAHGCPMPGAIFTGSTDEQGICAWHFGANGDEFRKVSEALADWGSVALVVNRARDFANDPDRATNGKAAEQEKAEAWAQLAAYLDHGWKLRTQPRDGELFVDWGRRLEKFLRNRVKERLRGITITDDDAPTPTVADMRSRVKGKLTPPKGSW